MNFGVTNGPMHLISLTEYPMMMVITQPARGGFDTIGINPGGAYPWCLPQHKMIWAEDDLPSLRLMFEEWRRSR
jgi:hypothetical protein